MATRADKDRTKDFVDVYRDGAGKWRWQRQSKNGEIIADSGQGYKDEKFALEMAKGVNSNVTDFRTVPVVDEQINHDG